MIIEFLDGIKKLFFGNSFAHSVSVLVFGTVGSQLLLVLAAPLLTRLYTPEDFGLLAVYSGLLALFSVVASLRYEIAIPLPKKNQEASSVMVLSLLVVMLMTGASALTVLVAGSQIALAFNTPRLNNYLWLLPFGVLLAGIYNVFNYWAVRTKAFSDIARTRISQTLVTLIVQIFGFKLGGIALLFSRAGGQGVGSIRLARLAVKHSVFKSWSFMSVKQAAIRYRYFSIYSTWSALFNTAGNQLPPLMFAAFFNSASAGLFALAQRILSLPISVITGAISKTFLSRAAEAHREGRLGALILDIYKSLAQVIMPPALILVVAAPEIFSLIFGDTWRLAGEMARWMAPWLMLVFILSPFMVLFEILERQPASLMFQFFLLGARLLSILVGFWFDDLMFAIQLFSISGVIFLIIFNYWMAHAAKCNFLGMMSVLLKSFFYGLIVVSPFFVGMFFRDINIIFIVSISCCLVSVSFYYYRIFSSYLTG